jgi:hypothetical protein
VINKIDRPIAQLLLSYAAYIILFLFYLACFIFVGFFLHLDINRWTLITAFASYSLVLAVILIIKKASRQQQIMLVVASVLTPLIFWGMATAFGYTYDTSYDGQEYHQSAIIELSNGWNPIYNSRPPLNIPGIDEPIDSGYGKVVWSIDASIYKLTNNIASTTLINLVVAGAAFIFLFSALRLVKIGKYEVLIIALLSVVTTLLLEQIFTHREDSLSYELLIVGLSSLLLLVRSKPKLSYFLCLAASLIFLAGVKDSNLFLFVPLILLALYFVFKNHLYKLTAFKISAAVGLLAGLLCLFNPYITNIVRYHAVDYPYNQASYSAAFQIEDKPHNLIKANRFELFYYGIFSAPLLGNEQDPSAIASPKLPFTLNVTQLRIEANVASKQVGGYGVLFSGVFLLSIVAYAYLAIRKKTRRERTIFIWLSVGLAAIIISCLLSPVPNYARFGSQLDLFPICVVVALLLMKPSKWKKEKIMAWTIILFLTANIGLDAGYSGTRQAVDFVNLDRQLTSLSHSDKTYSVHANLLYSNYLLLRSHGVKTEISVGPISCHSKIYLLDTSNSTTLCPI